jgi:XTP/dITP diphosphohydrolase
VITAELRGEQGFGYDPVFYLPELDKTMAELTLEDKNKYSHRARAAAKVPPLLVRLEQ